MVTRVNKIDYGASLELAEMMPPSLVPYYRELSNQGWMFWVVDQRRGRCYYGKKQITIPLWATKRSKDYLTWYIAHEMSHAYAGHLADHGPKFMEQLKRICPNDCIKHELGYKPRNAASAGITQFGTIDSILEI